jgi:Rhodopirellula transposase.
MIPYKIQATLTSVSARIPVNLPVTASETGGTVKVAIATPVRLQSLFCVIVAEVAVADSIFKEERQKLVDEIGVEIRIAHYPPYNSKYK